MDEGGAPIHKKHIRFKHVKVTLPRILIRVMLLVVRTGMVRLKGLKVPCFQCRALQLMFA